MAVGPRLLTPEATLTSRKSRFLLVSANSIPDLRYVSASQYNQISVVSNAPIGGCSSIPSHIFPPVQFSPFHLPHLVHLTSSLQLRPHGLSLPFIFYGEYYCAEINTSELTVANRHCHDAASKGDPLLRIAQVPTDPSRQDAQVYPPPKQAPQLNVKFVSDEDVCT